MTEKSALARRMRALAGRETTDVNTTRGIAIVTRMRLARANQHVHTQQLRRFPEKGTNQGTGQPTGLPKRAYLACRMYGAVKTDENQYQHVWREDWTQITLQCPADKFIPTNSSKKFGENSAQESFGDSCLPGDRGKTTQNQSQHLFRQCDNTSSGNWG